MCQETFFLPLQQFSRCNFVPQSMELTELKLGGGQEGEEKENSSKAFNSLYSGQVQQNNWTSSKKYFWKNLKWAPGNINPGTSLYMYLSSKILLWEFNFSHIVHWLFFFVHTNTTFQVQLQMTLSYLVVYPGCKFLHGRVIRAQVQNGISTSVDFQGLLPFRKQTLPLEEGVQALWHVSISHTPLYSWTPAQHVAYVLNKLQWAWITWLTPLEWGWQVLPLQLTPGAECHSTSGVTFCGLRTQLNGMRGSTHPSFLLQLHQNVSSPPCISSLRKTSQGTHTFGVDSFIGSSSRGFSLGRRGHVREMFI